MGGERRDGALPTSGAGWLAFGWGVGGVGAVLVEGVLRLAPIAAGVIEAELGALHWLTMGVWSAFMVYAESWRGFHLQFSPRVVARSLAVAADGRPWLVVLAPLVAMGLLYATRRRLAGAWGLVIGIVGMVVAIRALPAPWRAIADAGVVLGLGLGAVSLAIHVGAAALGKLPTIDPDLPTRT